MRDYIESIIALLRITWKILPPPSIKPQSTGCQAHMLYYRGATRLITLFGYTGAGVNSRYTKMLILSELIKSQVLKSQKAYPPEWEFKVTSVHYTDLSLWAVLYFIWNSGVLPKRRNIWLSYLWEAISGGIIIRISITLCYCCLEIPHLPVKLFKNNINNLIHADEKEFKYS